MNAIPHIPGGDHLIILLSAGDHSSFPCSFCSSSSFSSFCILIYILIFYFDFSILLWGRHRHLARVGPRSGGGTGATPSAGAPCPPPGSPRLALRRLVLGREGLVRGTQPSQLRHSYELVLRHRPFGDGALSSHRRQRATPPCSRATCNTTPPPPAAGIRTRASRRR